MKLGLQLDNNQLKKIYFQWNQGDLQSFLVEITSQIFGKSDELTSGDLIDQILDKAKQKLENGPLRMLGSGGSYSHDRCGSINAANFRYESHSTESL